MQAILRAATGVLAIVLGTLLVLLYTTRDETQRLRAEVERLTGESEAARERVMTLEAELASLEDPERIARLAREQLGMIPARPDQRVSLDEAERMAWAARTPTGTGASLSAVPSDGGAARLPGRADATTSPPQ